MNIVSFICMCKKNWKGMLLDQKFLSQRALRYRPCEVSQFAIMLQYIITHTLDNAKRA